MAQRRPKPSNQSIPPASLVPLAPLPPLIQLPPAPDPEWLRQFTAHLMAKRPKLPKFSAQQLALEAFEAMYLLTPFEASELWDERMLATNWSWRRMAGR